MKAEHIEELLANALVDLDEYVSGNNGDVIGIARAEIEAMQTPITPAALFAAGWNNDRENRWSYRVDLLEWIIVEFVGDEARLIGAVDYYPLTGCKTMHDLNELVRIIGGVK